MITDTEKRTAYNSMSMRFPDRRLTVFAHEDKTGLSILTDDQSVTINFASAEQMRDTLEELVKAIS